MVFFTEVVVSFTGVRGRGFSITLRRGDKLVFFQTHDWNGFDGFDGCVYVWRKNMFYYRWEGHSR